MVYTSPMIDEIIKSPSAKKALSSISPIYAESYVGLWLLEVIGRQLDDLGKWGREYGKQTVPYTATWSLPYWEEQYGIKSPTKPPADAEFWRLNGEKLLDGSILLQSIQYEGDPNNRPVTIEQRRNAILAKIQTRAPINPEKLGKIASLAAGVEVKIVEQPGSYIFRVEMTDQSDAYNKRALKEEIDLRKPAHLIYAIVIKMIADFLNEYRFTFERLTMSAKTSFYYPNVLRFDGERLFDGSAYMDNKEIGKHFNIARLRFRTGAQNVFPSLVLNSLAIFGAGIENRLNVAYRQKFAVRTVFYAPDPNFARLDGEKLLDGSFTLESVEAGRFFIMSRATFGADVRNAYEATTKDAIGIYTRTENRVSIAPKFALDATTQNRLTYESAKISLGTATQNKLNPKAVRFSMGSVFQSSVSPASTRFSASARTPNRISPETTRISISARNQNQTTVTLTKDSYWTFEKGTGFNGAKRFNAAVIREEF